MTKHWWLYAIIGIGAIIVCRLFFETEKVAPAPRDYPEIVANDTLRVTMEYNDISLVEGTDSIEGFYLELIEAFARDHDNLVLKVSPEMSMENRLQGLLDGRYDMIADGIPIMTGRDDSLLFSRPIARSYQVLVQRKPLTADDSAKYINSQVMLAGKTLHLVENSPAILRIENLMEEIGDTIYVNTIEKYGAEQLIALVAHADIDYAVCDHHIAVLAADSLPNIDISIPIGFTQFYSWGMRKDSPVLCDSINQWLDRFMKSSEFRRLSKKYAVDYYIYSFSFFHRKRKNQRERFPAALSKLNFGYFY